MPEGNCQFSMEIGSENIVGEAAMLLVASSIIAKKMRRSWLPIAPPKLIQ